MVVLGIVVLAAWLLLREKREPANQGVPESYLPIRYEKEIWSEHEADDLVAQFQPYRISGV